MSPTGAPPTPHYRETRAVFERTARLLDGFYDADATGPRAHTKAQRRVRALVHELAGFGSARRPAHVAELGCGRADLGRAMLARLPAGSTLTGVDFSPTTLGIARRVCESLDARFAQADLRALPFADRHFDLTLLINVLHHIEPDDQPLVLREAARVTRGALIVEIKNQLHPYFALYHPGYVLNGPRIHPTRAGAVERTTVRCGLERTATRGTWGAAALSPLVVMRLDRAPGGLRAR
ncbi:MAG: class I SAM-dependent methyltransferase [Myxococcales bacterium]|nr:class I SAM-dependent methyltransferase [Myxococcales bacterium]